MKTVLSDILFIKKTLQSSIKQLNINNGRLPDCNRPIDSDQNVRLALLLITLTLFIAGIDFKF